MRIFYLGNNRLGFEVCRFLVDQGASIVGAAVHPAPKRGYGDELLACLGREVPVFEGPSLRDPETLDRIRRLEPDLGLSVLFDYILKKPFLDIFPRGCLNLHPAYLPYNRGQYPNVWSIVEATPAGTTLHYIDEGIDTGDLVAQREVAVEPHDTGQSLYAKLMAASLELFQDTWPLIVQGKATGLTQTATAGTYHRTRDVDQIDEIHLDRAYQARDLINVLRARSFPPYEGAYFRTEGGKKIFLRLELDPEDDEGA